jgi:pyruvate,water dikinase
MQTMFGLSDLASGKSSRCRLLDTDLAIDIYLLDVGGGFREPGEGETVAVDRVASRPFLALWQGLSHPDVDWDSHLHFDWKGFSDAALSGGVVSGGAKEFASYAIVSGDYCNLNMRFGYHFTLVDCLCGDELRGNYCQLRFAGGGGDYQGRSLRIRLLTLILGRLGGPARRPHRRDGPGQPRRAARHGRPPARRHQAARHGAQGRTPTRAFCRPILCRRRPLHRPAGR